MRIFIERVAEGGYTPPGMPWPGRCQRARLRGAWARAVRCEIFGGCARCGRDRRVLRDKRGSGEPARVLVAVGAGQFAREHVRRVRTHVDDEREQQVTGRKRSRFI